MSADELGNNLKELRARRRITQQQLAERCTVTRKTINTVENGVFVPSTLLALRLAIALEVTVEDIFYIKGSPTVRAVA